MLASTRRRSQGRVNTAFLKGFSCQILSILVRFTTQYDFCLMWNMADVVYGICRHRYKPGKDMSNSTNTQIHSGKLTQQWNITIFSGKYIFKGSIFHCYVSLPEGIYYITWCMISFHQTQRLSKTARSTAEEALLLQDAQVRKPVAAGMGLEGCRPAA